MHKYLLVKALLLIFTLTFWTSSLSQNPNYYTLTKNDGLPSNGIYDIFQDKKGFMWFATQKGLSKFDGSTFKTYSLESQSNVAGSAISEDQYGRIWYCNFDGFLYYVENNVLKALPQTETIGYFKFGIVKNRLFLIQKNKVVIYDLATLKIIKNIPFKSEKIYNTFSDEDNFYVVLDSLLKISPDGTETKYDLPVNFTKNNTAVIIQKSKEGLMIVSKESKKYYAFNNKKFTENSLPKNFKLIQNVGFTGEHSWFCTTSGAYKMNSEKNKTDYKLYFPDFNITTVFKDSQNNYWFGTQNKGLLLIPDLKSIIIPLNSRPLKISSYKDDYLVSTDQDEIFLYSPLKQSVTKFYEGTTKHPINQLTVNEDNGSVYFTSSHFNILSKNGDQNRTFFSVKDVKKVDEKYYSFAASGSSGVFMVNENLKSSWDPYFKRDKETISRFNETSIIPNANGKCTIFNSVNQCIYFGTNQGLFYKNFQGTTELKFEGKSLYISSLACYKSFIFGLSTNGTLLKIGANQAITELKLPASLKKEEIYRIKIIDDTLFLITENALWGYDLLTNATKMLMYGIQEMDLTDLVKSNEGFLLMTAQGILVAPETKLLSSQILHFLFTEVTANDKIVPFNNLQKLQSDETNLRINFAVLAFIPGHQPEIFYRINREKWQVLEKASRSLLLSSLQHGNYTVEFRTKSGTVISPIYKIKFAIEKPFYLRAYFLIPAILLLAFLIYLLFAFRLKKIRQQNALALEKINLEKNVNQSKLKAIKSQMNPHFFYNALNTIQAYILSNEKKLAVGYLSKFSLLTRTILEMTEKESVTIGEEIKILTLYLDLEKVRFNDDFTYEIIPPNDPELMNYNLPTMLLQPYLENALKHGLLHKKGQKNLKISFQESGENLLISISDNGIGREKSNKINALRANKPQPFATDATNQRIDLLNTSHVKKIEITYEDLVDEKGESTGTTVLIKFPLTQNTAV